MREKVARKSSSKKLTPYELKRLKKKYESGIKNKYLGQQFGINTDTVRKIAKRHGWKRGEDD